MNFYISALFLAASITQALSQGKKPPGDFLAVVPPVTFGGKGDAGRFINSYDTDIGFDNYNGGFKGPGKSGVSIGFIPHGFGPGPSRKSGPSIARAVAAVFGGNKDLGKNDVFDGATKNARDIAYDAGYKISIDGSFDDIGKSGKSKSSAPSKSDNFKSGKIEAIAGAFGGEKDFGAAVQDARDLAKDAGYKITIDGSFKDIDISGKSKKSGKSDKGGGRDAVSPNEFADFKPNEKKTLRYHSLFPGFKPITLEDSGKDSWFSHVKRLMDKSYPKFPDLSREGTAVWEPHPSKLHALPYGTAPLYVSSDGKGSVYVPFKLPHTEHPLYVPFDKHTKKLNYPSDPIYIPWIKLVIEQKKGYGKYAPYIPFQPDKERDGKKEGAPILIPFIKKDKYFPHLVPYLPVVEERGKKDAGVFVAFDFKKKLLHY